MIRFRTVLNSFTGAPVQHILIGLLLSTQFLLLEAKEEQIRFRHFTVEDGLSQSWVKSIFQDSYGYLWFGTGGNGVNKYNAYEFKIYKNNARDTNSLSNNWITSIYEDGQRNLWIGAQRGVSRYDPYQDMFIRCPRLQSEYCLSFFETQDGSLYVLTLRNIFKLDPLENTAEPICDSANCISDIFVGSVVEDEHGNLWVASSNGLYRLDLNGKSLSVIRHKPGDPRSLSDNELECLYKDAKGRIWVGTVNKGLSLMQFQKGKTETPWFINFEHEADNLQSISSGRIRSLLDDEKGRLWIGLENGGLDILNLDQIGKKDPVFHHYTYNKFDESSLGGNSIYALYKDKQETVWIGTYGNGISYYNVHLFDFEHYKHISGNPNSLINNLVNTIYKDDQGQLWLGTEGGISIIDSTLSVYKAIVHDPRNKNSIGSNAVWAIHKDKKGRFWFGTWGGGLNLYHPESGKFTRFLYNPNDPNSLGGNNVFGITEDKNGVLWVACMNGGLNKFDYDRHTNTVYKFDISSKNSISSDWVRTTFINSYNELWVSTSDAVDLFDPETERFIHFVNDPADSTSISYNGAVVIFEDSKRNLWFGTEGGLNCFIREDSSFIYYREEDGLPDNTIKGICEDSQGNLWLSSNKGITLFWKGTDKPASPEFLSWGINDGLQGDEFNRRSFFKDDKGYLYFGGIRGLNIFHPDSLKNNSYVPPVVFTNFSLFNKPVDFRKGESPIHKHINFMGSEKIVLSHKETVISIEYAALNYIVPEKNLYSYKMEGFDKEWHDVGNKREATYTNLDPGQYTFRVKASNNDGIWNEVGIAINITILPPWWKTIWMKIILVLLTVGLVLAFYYLRLNRLRIQKRQLEKMVEQRTAVIEEKNVMLQMQTDELNEINAVLEERQQHIEEQAEELRAQAEELNTSNQTLRKLNATKDRFFSIIAHDLKNPFASILGFCEVLSLRYDKYDDDKRKHLIGAIESSAKNIFKLLENLLQWARSQTGSLQYSPEEFNLNELIHNIEVLLENSLINKNLSFRKNIPPDLNIYADKNMLYTVVRNIITNAIKFTESGEINLEVRVTQKELNIAISDTGIGIRPEIIDRLFEVERSKSTEGTRGEPGTGLGLIICKEFIDKHEGSILVQSEYGKGSTFTIILPRKSAS